MSIPSTSARMRRAGLGKHRGIESLALAEQLNGPRRPILVRPNCSLFFPKFFQPADSLFVTELCEQLTNCECLPGKNHARKNLIQWLQHKASLMRTGMRQGESGAAPDFLAKPDEI